MARSRAPYDTAEFERVKRNLCGFLTYDEAHASELVKNHPEEVRPLADVLEAMKEQLNHKWSGAALAQIPPSELVCDHNQMVRIKADSASMRFLGTDILVEGGLPLVKVRESLLDGLVDAMSPAAKDAYKPMLSWTEVEECEFLAGDAPLSSDTLFGQELVFLEQLWSDQVAEYDSHFRLNERLPKNVATPSAVTRINAERAVNHLRSHLDKWLSDEESLSASIPESLLARVGVNVTVNRMLLERASKNARGLEAAAMTESFVRELNRMGITEVPDEMFECPNDQAPTRLQAWLATMFAHDGLLIESGTYFARHMTNSDIAVIVKWSSWLQVEYMRLRGMPCATSSMPDLDREKAVALSKEAHGSPANYFIFALTLVAAFYDCTSTDREFKGHKNRNFAVFPNRADISNGNSEQPTVHVSELLQHAYGQMYYSSPDCWGLAASGIREYAENMSIKRAYAEQLLMYAAKARSSRQLLAVHQNLAKILLKARGNVAPR